MSETVQKPSEQTARFQFLKAIVRKGQAAFFVVGVALAEIRANQLYKIDGYKTWEEFCEKEYGWSKRYCNQLVVEVGVMRMLPANLQSLVTNERAARELAQLPESLREEVAEAASEGGKKPITAPAIRAASPPPPAKKKPSSPPPAKPAKTGTNGSRNSTQPVEIERDETGFPIPDAVKPLWDRRVEAREILTYMRAIKVKVNRASTGDDPLFRACNFNEIKAGLERAEADLALAVPFAVCPTCVGKLAENCSACKKTGLVSEFFWKTCVPEETKALRAKQVKKSANA